MKHITHIIITLLFCMMTQLSFSQIAEETLKNDYFGHKKIPTSIGFAELISACYNHVDNKTIILQNEEIGESGEFKHVFKLSELVTSAIDTNTYDVEQLEVDINEMYQDILTIIDSMDDQAFESEADLRDLIALRYNKMGKNVDTVAWALDDMYAELNDTIFLKNKAIEKKMKAFEILTNAKIDTLNNYARGSIAALSTHIDTAIDQTFTTELKNKLIGVEVGADATPIATHDRAGKVRLSEDFEYDAISETVKIRFGSDLIREFAQDTTQGSWHDLPRNDDKWTRLIKEISGGKTRQVLQVLRYDPRNINDYIFSSMHVDSTQVILGQYRALEKRGRDNVLIGHRAGFGLDSLNEYNVMVGHKAGYITDSVSSHNVFVGNKAGYNNGGDKSTIIGSNAVAGHHASANQSIVIGHEALGNAKTNHSIILGNGAAQYNFSDNNIVIGHQAAAGPSDNGGNIVIGNGVALTTIEENTLLIGNADTRTIEANLATGEVRMDDLTTTSLQTTHFEAANMTNTALSSDKINADSLMVAFYLEARHAEIKYLDSIISLRAETIRATDIRIKNNATIANTLETSHAESSTAKIDTLESDTIFTDKLGATRSEIRHLDVTRKITARDVETTNFATANNKTTITSGHITTDTLSVKTVSVIGDIGGNTATITGYGTIPIGGIIMWSGTIGNIPAGWALCDGKFYDPSNAQNSSLQDIWGTAITPNLTDRFIMAGKPTTDYANNESDRQLGNNSFTIEENNLPQHTHTTGYFDATHKHDKGDFEVKVLAENSEHKHIARGSELFKVKTSGDGKARATKSTWDNDNEDLGGGAGYTTRTDGKHTHAVSFTGTTGYNNVNLNHNHTIFNGPEMKKDPIAFRPPYYTLAFIMRVK